MKEILKSIAAALANSAIGWFFLKIVARPGGFLLWSRKHYTEQQLNKTLAKKLFKDLVVRHGPFKGMQYPKLASVGSTMLPKLLGSYEKELQETIIEFSKNDYSEIIDVGCAEGYYAVGLARNNEEATVYAYDTDERARRLCQEMAEVNKVRERVIVKAECTTSDLEHFTFKGRGLVVCDCEGYEKQLFTQANIQNLKKCDLIIEAHDFVDLTISQYLQELFKETHNIRVIQSLADTEKVRTYRYAELDGLSEEEKKQVLAEKRPVIMQWLICTPNKL